MKAGKDVVFLGGDLGFCCQVADWLSRGENPITVFFLVSTLFCDVTRV